MDDPASDAPPSDKPASGKPDSGKPADQPHDETLDHHHHTQQS